MSKDKFICESAKSRVNSNSSNAFDACDSANIPVSDACDASASASVTKDAYDNPEMVNKIAIRALILLLIAYVFGTLCLQGFNLLFKQVGTDVSSPEQASLITGLPGIVLGIACFIYGSLGDFVSLRKLVTVGLSTLFIGSVFGFLANFFFTSHLWSVILARMIQSAGEQVAGSAYLVIVSKYLRKDLKVIFFGLFTAGYQISAAIGIFTAGLLSSISWRYFFLIPAITIFFLPALRRYLPQNNGNGRKIDRIGFVIFGAAVAILTVFFSYHVWWMLVISIVLFIIFGIYINKAKNPFVTPSFFKNKRWLSAMLVLMFLYFTNYCFTPIFNRLGGELYKLTTFDVAHYVVCAFVVAALAGTSSGKIIARVGRKNAVILASVLMAIGWAISGFFVMSGFFALTFGACVYYAGCGLMYSPLVSIILDSLPVEETGRGCGMNDLAMSVTTSIGIVIFYGLINNRSLEGFSLIGLKGSAAGFSNVLLIGSVVSLLGLFVFVIRNYVYSRKTKRSSKSVKA